MKLEGAIAVIIFTQISSRSLSLPLTPAVNLFLQMEINVIG